MDPEANNTNALANTDAPEDCTYNLFGCMDPLATNYNSEANVDDGMCQYDPLALPGKFGVINNPDDNDALIMGSESGDFDLDEDGYSDNN